MTYGFGRGMVSYPADIATSNGQWSADASARRAQLRRLIAEIEARAVRAPRATPAGARSSWGAADEPELLADAVRRETCSGPFTYREVVYPLRGCRGSQPLGELGALSGATMALLAPGEDLESAEADELYFLDIETTGLGGAGAIAFLVATARIERREVGAEGNGAEGDGAEQTLVLRQYLAESPPEEAALLEALIADADLASDPVLVSYNGRVFDAPLLDERATLHRQRAGFEALRQLDLLRAARTGYRGLLPDCRQGSMEWGVLSASRPPTDVPGAEVPGVYFQFLRTGSRRLLDPIVGHNELDVLGMAGLLAFYAGLLDRGRRAAGRDALALGRLLDARRDDRAEHYLEVAATGADTPGLREEGMLRLAALHKRAGRRRAASELWERTLALPTSAPLGPLVELAMYYEHQCHDFERASGFAMRARTHLAALSRSHPWPSAPRKIAELDHRLERLRRKIERAGEVASGGGGSAMGRSGR